MDWKDIASVELPTTAQTGDLIAVVDQLQQQVKAALSPKSADPAIPHVKALAPVVEDAFDTLIAARDTLREAEARRTPATATTAAKLDTPTANTAADDAWRAFEKFLDASRLLDDDFFPGRAEAEQIHGRLFASHGLRFINYRPRRQWDVAQQLVAILAEPDTAKTLDGLGAARFVQAVHASHKDFGAAFGFSRATPVAPDVVTSTRALQLELQGALRDYLVKVAAQVSPKRPETAALARFLLQPYTDMADDLARTPRAPATAKPAPAPQPTA